MRDRAGAAGRWPTRIVASGKTLSRIAFGSCAKQSKEQPIWDAINAAKPDLFIFLGDNIYADTRDPKVMADKYAHAGGQARLPETAREHADLRDLGRS